MFDYIFNVTINRLHTIMHLKLYSFYLKCACVFLCKCLYIQARNYTLHSPHTEVRVQLARVGSPFPLCVYSESNSGYQMRSFCINYKIK